MGSPARTRRKSGHSSLLAPTNAPYAWPALRLRPCCGKTPVWQPGTAQREVRIGWIWRARLTTVGSVDVEDEDVDVEEEVVVEEDDEDDVEEEVVVVVVVDPGSVEVVL